MSALFSSEADDPAHIWKNVEGGAGYGTFET